MSWILLFGLLLAIFPTVIVLLWLLHQKGFFDPLYDWWDDRSDAGQNKTRSKHRKGLKRSHTRNLQEDYDMHHNGRNHPSHMQKKRRSSSHTHHHKLQRHADPALDLNDHYQRKNNSHPHAHKERHKHRSSKGYSQGYRTSRAGPLAREMEAVRDPRKISRKYEEKQPGRRHSKQLDDRREFE